MTLRILDGKVTVRRPTATELADAFCEMNETEQAEFFNRIGEVAKKWLPVQMNAIARSDVLSSLGQRTINIIGEYSNENERRS